MRLYLAVGDEMAYPDSVSRVSPPNTTSPKTLAALPSSQYATPLLEVWGKNFAFAGADFAEMFSARELKGEALDPAVATFSWKAAALLLNRMFLEMYDRMEASCSGRGFVVHWRHTKKLLDSFGAVRRMAGRIEGIGMLHNVSSR